MNKAVEQLLEQPGIWRAGEHPRSTGLDHITTGFGTLDDSLPGDGWPLGALTEILHDQQGIGELRLLMPALTRLSRQGRWVALVAPPHVPYPPALAAYGLDLSRVLLIHPRNNGEALWALEQALRTGTCGAVLAWPRQIDARHLRRLQLAAESGRSWGVLFRSSQAAAQHSPAALRLQLKERRGRALLDLLKCRGGTAGQTLLLDLDRPDPHPEQPQFPQLPETIRDTGRRIRSNTQRPHRNNPRRPPLPQMELPLPGLEQGSSSFTTGGS